MTPVMCIWTGSASVVLGIESGTCADSLRADNSSDRVRCVITCKYIIIIELCCIFISQLFRGKNLRAINPFGGWRADFRHSVPQIDFVRSPISVSASCNSGFLLDVTSPTHVHP